MNVRQRSSALCFLIAAFVALAHVSQAPKASDAAKPAQINTPQIKVGYAELQSKGLPL